MVILFKLTTRSRPDKARKTIKSITDNVVGPYKLVISADLDDLTMVGFEGATYGTSKSKVDAINRDVPSDGWDVLVNVSDDQVFHQHGFDDVIRQHFKDTTDLFLHLPDGYLTTELPTMSIMGHEYYQRFGYIYHPDYFSLWCDNEAMDVAKALGKYKYVDAHIFTHEHPAWTGERPDAQLVQTQSHYRRDERVYNKRKSMGFPLNSVY